MVTCHRRFARGQGGQDWGVAKHAAVTVGGITVELSRPGKVLFPRDGITKGDLVEYYRAVAPSMLPHLRGRPLALARYPDGIDGSRIFQKNVTPSFPDWVSRTEVGKQGGTVCQVIADKPATLVYLANQACVELHAFLSRDGRYTCPDQLVVDLDPPDRRRFSAAREAALLVRDVLENELNLTTYVKTTGGKGLHVHLPLDGHGDTGRALEFARGLAGLMATRRPDLITTEQRRDQRGDLVYADIMRNAYAQTVIAPYAVRARPGAPVAMPVTWDDVASPSLDPGAFTLRSVPGRLERRGRGDDPWAGMSRHRYSVARACERLAKLTGARLAGSR
jgi:bifunctional non-homologous end joining protein LigD